jgi:hypothetical protein
MANPLKMTCFYPERLAMAVEDRPSAADLAQVCELRELLHGESPSGRYLEEGR